MALAEWLNHVFVSIAAIGLSWNNIPTIPIAIACDPIGVLTGHLRL